MRITTRVESRDNSARLLARRRHAKLEKRPLRQNGPIIIAGEGRARLRKTRKPAAEESAGPIIRGEGADVKNVDGTRRSSATWLHLSTWASLAKHVSRLLSREVGQRDTSAKRRSPRGSAEKMPLNRWNCLTAQLAWATFSRFDGGCVETTYTLELLE